MNKIFSVSISISNVLIFSVILAAALSYFTSVVGFSWKADCNNAAGKFCYADQYTGGTTYGFPFATKSIVYGGFTGGGDSYINQNAIIYNFFVYFIFIFVVFIFIRLYIKNKKPGA